MKISKLTIAALLTMGLVLTGCNNKKASSVSSSSSADTSSSSELNPVTKIKITTLTRALVVGEKINLDDYIEVVGGEGGPKAFSAALTTGEGVVTLDGKELTAVGEGKFVVKITAGEKSNNFEGESLSRESAAFKTFLDSFPEEYGVQLLKIQAEEFVDDSGKVVIHRNNYNAHFAWTDDEGPGGWFIAQNDTIYNWEANDVYATSGFKAVPGPVGSSADWFHYYFNMPLSLNFSDFGVARDETTGELQGFYMTDEVPGDDKFPTAIDLLMYCGCGYDFRDDYDKTLYVEFEETSEDVFAYTFVLEYTTDENSTPENLEDDKTYVFPFRFLLEEDDITIPAVEEYIESGEHPEPIPFTEITTKATEIFESKDYAYQSVYGWFSSSFQMYSPASVAAGLGLDAEYLNDYYPYGVEQGVATAKGTYGSYTERVFEDVEGGGVNQIGTTTYVHGFYEKDGAVYQYSKDDGETDFTVQNTGAQTLWTQLKNYVGAALVPSANYEVGSRTENEDGSITFKIANGSSTAAEIATAVNYFGPYNFESRIQKSAQYIYAQITVGANYATFCWGINFGAIYGQVLTIANIGASNVLPVTDADLFPEA